MTRLSLLLLLTLPGAVAAQTAPQPLFPQGRGSFFALSVPDAAASAKWYVEKFGMSIIMQIPKQNKHTVIVLKGGALTVELIQNDDAVPLSTVIPPKGDAFPVHGIMKVGLTVEDFEGTLKQMRARGIEVVHGPWAKSAEQPAQVIIRDNAGNLIQIFGP